MAYINNFEDNAFQGKFFEKVVLKRIKDFFLGTAVYIPYDNNSTIACEIQRRGIDGYIKTYKPKLDIKTRLDHRFYRQDNNDICIEVKLQDLNSGRETPGWYYYSQSDFIIYVWVNKVKDDLEREGYIIPIRNPNVKKFLDNYIKNNNGKWSYSESGNRMWKTYNVFPKVSQFPENTLMRFDPSSKVDGSFYDRLIAHLLPPKKEEIVQNVRKRNISQFEEDE